MRFQDEQMHSFYRHWMCDTDGCDGEMMRTGITLTSYPPQCQHRCNKCSRDGSAPESYPTVVHQTVPELTPEQARRMVQV